MGKSTETFWLLTNEQKALRDNLRKSGLGYNGPYVLSQAYAKIPKLYRAYKLCDKNEQLHVFDSEDTLEDAEKSQLKMKEFQKDEKVQKLKIKPIDYEKLNKIYDDFVPQKELSAEQTYSPSSLISSEESSSKTKPSMASMPMENDLDETVKQHELLKDRLLKASLAEDIKNLVITSCVKIRNKDLHDATERILKDSKDVSNESKTADTHKSRENNSLKTLQKENKNFMASLQLENAHLKQTYKYFFESVQRTAKFEVYFEKLENTKVVLERKLARKIDDSKAEKDQFLKEINHLRTQLENLKGKRVETKFENSSILGKPPLLNNERDQLLKQIAFLKSKLASQDIRSCQKEYHELRTSYNALKVKFHYLNRKKWNINVSKSSKPKESVSEKVHTGESSKPFSRRVSQFTNYSFQKDRKFSKKSQSFETFFLHKGFKTRVSNVKN
ncbi:hypothetical protein Tco_0322960 [Tanacetum coccineum]